MPEIVTKLQSWCFPSFSPNTTASIPAVQCRRERGTEARVPGAAQRCAGAATSLLHVGAQRRRRQIPRLRRSSPAGGQSAAHTEIQTQTCCALAARTWAAPAALSLSPPALSSGLLGTAPRLGPEARNAGSSPGLERPEKQGWPCARK